MTGLTIRVKLALLCGGMMATILACHVGAVYLLARDYSRAMIDSQLAVHLGEFMDEVARAVDEEDLRERLGRSFLVRDGYDYQVSTMRGRVLFLSRYFHFGDFAGPPAASKGRPSFVDLRYDYGNRAERFRLASRVISGWEGPLLIHCTTSLEKSDEALGWLQSVLLTTGPIALAVTIAGGYFFARRALAPVDRMAAAAAAISARRLSRRIDIVNPGDELGRLASTLNDMIGRLDRSFEEVRRFTADAAHELRTPLTLIRTEIEVALRGNSSPPDPDLFEAVLEEVDRLTRLVTQLLSLCREDVGLESMEPQAIPLDEVVCGVADHMAIVAEERGQTLAFGRLDPCSVCGDEDRLRQLDRLFVFESPTS